MMRSRWAVVFRNLCGRSSGRFNGLKSWGEEDASQYFTVSVLLSYKRRFLHNSCSLAESRFRIPSLPSFTTLRTSSFCFYGIALKPLITPHSSPLCVGAIYINPVVVTALNIASHVIKIMIRRLNY